MKTINIEEQYFGTIEIKGQKFRTRNYIEVLSFPINPKQENIIRNIIEQGIELEETIYSKDFYYDEFEVLGIVVDRILTNLSLYTDDNIKLIDIDKQYCITIND